MVTLCWVQQVAAIFKIGNSKDIPQIPESLSNDAKSFIKLCLQRDPPARPTASELLNHPFIRDQATTRVANMNVTKDAFPYMFDGSRTPVMPKIVILFNKKMLYLFKFIPSNF
jgi:mitogen-activated protein kinase kinase kinase 3